MEDILNDILDFFTALGEIIDACVSFLFTIIEDILMVITLTAEFVISIPEILGWLPASVLTIIIGIFSVVVIYKILGREG